MMSFQEELDLYNQVYHCQIQREPPVECLKLIRKARQEGLPFRKIYVLSQPLSPQAAGGCNPQTGEIWAWLQEGQENGVQQMLRSLLHELAHLIAPPLRPYQGIDDDWDEERQTWQRAYALARQWDMQHILPEEALKEELEAVEHWREDHWAAGLLAGSIDPMLARRAYRALTDIRHSQQWSWERFSQALQGCSDDPFDNVVVVDFDRSVLRSSWGLPWSQGGSFGPYLALRQQDESAHFLRHALEHLAQMKMPSLPTWRRIHESQICFFEVNGSEAFINALFWTQRLLLNYDTVDHMSALVHWWLYADETLMRVPHLYRLSISYTRSAFFAPKDEYRFTAEQEPEQIEVWFLFSNVSPHLTFLETAWQRYICSWLRTQELRSEPLCNGLPTLWSWFK